MGKLEDKVIELESKTDENRLTLIDNFYSTFINKYSDNRQDDVNWMFTNNGFSMIIYFKYGVLHTLLKAYADRKMSYMFGYNIIKMDAEDNVHVEAVCCILVKIFVVNLALLITH
jgi:hypothetical protein